ncbi:MAG TPA: hypothetical protein VGX78_20305 [Pirellulales bacterium]|nr:hypothetical protein [Pirellulales bacterium]
MHRAEQGPGDGGVGIRVATAHHRTDHPFLKTCGVQQLVKGVLKGDQYPAHLAREVRRRRVPGSLNGFPHVGMGIRAICLGQASFIAFLATTADYCNGDRGGEDAAGILTDRMGMSQAAVSSRPVGRVCRLTRGKDTQRANPHQRAV